MPITVSEWLKLNCKECIYNGKYFKCIKNKEGCIKIAKNHIIYDELECSGAEYQNG